jgi:hypothetical protein
VGRTAAPGRRRARAAPATARRPPSALLAAWHAPAAPAGDKLANGTAEIAAGYAYDFAAGARRLAAAHPASAGGTCVLLGDDASLLHTAAAAAKAALRCRALVSRLEPGWAPAGRRAARPLPALPLPSPALPRRLLPWPAAPCRALSAPPSRCRRRRSYAHSQRSFNAQPLRNRCARTKKYLVDLEILARSDYSLGSVHSNVDLLAWHLRRCVAGRPAGTYIDLAGVSFEAFCPKVNSYMIPPEIRELYPEALAGHVDTGTAEVAVAGRRRRGGGGAAAGGGGEVESFEARVDAAMTGVLGISGEGRRAGLLGLLRSRLGWSRSSSSALVEVD